MFFDHIQQSGLVYGTVEVATNCMRVYMSSETSCFDEVKGKLENYKETKHTEDCLHHPNPGYFQVDLLRLIVWQPACENKFLFYFWSMNLQAYGQVRTTLENIQATCSQLLLYKTKCIIILHCKNIWVTSTIFWSSQLHAFCVSETLAMNVIKGCLQFESKCSWEASPFC